METRVQYFDCLCRTCMNKVEASSHDGITIPQKQWLSIFDIFEECGALRIAELLSDAVPQIVVQPSDELPKKICSECLQRLLSVYRFQQMCVQSDKQMHELLSKEQTLLKTPMLEGAIKGETEIHEADSQPLKELRCSSTLHNLQQPSIQEALAEVTVQTIEQEAAESSAANHLQDNTQLLEYCNNSQDEFEELIKNEPIEDDEEANSEYSDGETMHSIVSVTKEEVLPIEFEDQQVNDSSSHRQVGHVANRKDYCHVCHFCRKSYIDEWFLTRHLRKEHSIESKGHSCEFCNKNFSSSDSLRRHIHIHTGERPYLCSDCGKSFNHPGSLARHRYIHTGDKPHKCPYCPMRFIAKSDLERHKRVHEGVKRHECDFCGQHQLKIHIRKHTGEKPYKCKYCERAFISSSILSKHLRTHLGKNIYRCELCPLAFPLHSEMRLHFTSHKNEDPKTREQNLKALQEKEAKLDLKYSKKETEKSSTEEQQQQKFSKKEIEQPSIE